MHAASVILLSWAMIGAACCAPSAGGLATAFSLAVLVAFVGLPHGAADHRFARPRLEPVFGPAWIVVFLLGYAIVAWSVALGWFLAPAATIVLFFLLSAWHFGQEEPRLPIGPRSLRPVFRFARGGLVIWTPLVFRNDEVLRMLEVITPNGLGPETRWAVGALTGLAWSMLMIAAVAWCLQGMAAVEAVGRRRRALFLDNALVVSLVTLLAVTSTVVGFLVYFCAWHSARGLQRLRRELGESWWQLAASLAPLTVASVALISVGAAAALRASSWDVTLIRATFVGLSAVAVPHLLLHGAEPLLENFRNRRSFQPLHLGRSS
jgi:Brp/Blh family beta-carotene 15,15'-monooxygenase